jgi:hypothetical protein
MVLGLMVLHTTVWNLDLSKNYISKRLIINTYYSGVDFQQLLIFNKFNVDFQQIWVKSHCWKSTLTFIGNYQTI